MITIEFTKDGKTGSKKVHTFALESTLGFYRRAGYTIISDGTATAAPVETPATAAQTGRVGRGLAVHEIIAGHAKCGSSFRRNHIGQTTYTVRITGEEVTCTKCH